MLINLLKEAPAVVVELLWQEVLTRPVRAGTLALAAPLFLLRRWVLQKFPAKENRNV